VLITDSTLITLLVPCTSMPSTSQVKTWLDEADEVVLCFNNRDDLTRLDLIDRVKVVSSPLHGLAHSLNLGVTASSGKFIRRMDSDDVLLYGAIEKQKAIFENTQADVVFDSAHSFSTSFRLPSIVGTPGIHNIPAWIFLFCNPVIHPAVLTTRQWLLNNPYPSVFNEDHGLWLRVARHTVIHCTGHIGLEYRRSKDQRSSKLTLQRSEVEVQAALWRTLVREEFQIDFCKDESEKIYASLFSHGDHPQIMSVEALSKLYSLIFSRIDSLDRSIKSFYQRYAVISLLRLLRRQKTSVNVWKLFFDHLIFNVRITSLLNVILKKLAFNLMLHLDIRPKIEKRTT